LDLILTHGKGKNDFFRNNGDGTFTEIARDIGIEDWDGRGAAVSVGDYDNDGWPDLYMANADEDRLFKNVNGESFLDVTAEVGLDSLPEARGMSAAWGDYNNDGFLDLYVTNHVNLDTTDPEHQDRLLLNENGERFTDVSHLLPFEDLNGYGFIGGWTDFDNDSDLDIFLVNDCGFQLDGVTNTKVFRNDGGTTGSEWIFTEVAAEIGADQCHSGMGLATGDYNRDGWMDYFYTNIGENTLLLQNQGGTFEDVTEAAGVMAFDQNGIEIWSWGANFFDSNLDGWLDLYVDAGTLYLAIASNRDPQRNLFFMNKGDGTFENMSAESGMDSFKRSRTSIYGDYDNDGDPDLFLVNGNEEVYLYQNDQSTNHNWLIVDLEGTISNRSGIGARLTLTATDGSKQYWETRSGSSLGGGDDLAAYFGLGTAAIDSLVIDWPSGLSQVLTGLDHNQRILINESTTNVAIDNPVPESNNIQLASYPNPFSESVNFDIRLSPFATNGASLEIFDILGRRVFNQSLAAGYTGQFRWDGTDYNNIELPAGVYMARILTDDAQSEYHLLVKR
nr:VCBS repeat-containing protein [Rhodothermaceae bacterium]